MILSIACVIHCILMPVVISTLPSWGLSWLASPVTHQVLAVTGIAIGIGTLIPGWRIHRRSTVLILAGFGLWVMNYAAFNGSQCCANMAGKNTNDLLASCTESCNTTVPEQTSLPQQTRKSGFFTEVISVYGWFWTHPTAFGALLLAWAHCLNGVCQRPCCQRDTEVTYDLTPDYPNRD